MGGGADGVCGMCGVGGGKRDRQKGKGGGGRLVEIWREDRGKVGDGWRQGDMRVCVWLHLWNQD